VVTPVLARESKEKLWEVLELMLRDQRQAWVLGSNGAFSQVHGAPEAVGTHATLMELARRRSE
jgi:polyphosphate kinase